MTDGEKLLCAEYTKVVSFFKISFHFACVANNFLSKKRRMFTMHGDIQLFWKEQSSYHTHMDPYIITSN